MWTCIDIAKSVKISVWGLNGFAELVLLSWGQFLSHWHQDVATAADSDADLPGCGFEIAAKGSEARSGVLRLLEATGITWMCFGLL